MITVSMAAQIGTIPFLLHYFHQFPTWFLLANLMVIPLVSVILYLAFIVFAVAPIFPSLGILMTHVLDWSGQAMLFSVHFVEHLPCSVLDGIYPSDLTLFLFVLLAILATVFIVYKSRTALIGALISIIMLLIFNNISIYEKITRKEVIVFNLPGKTLIAFTTGNETIWLTTDKRNEVEKLKIYTKPYEGFRGIKKSSIICLSDSSIQNSNKLFCKESFLNFEGLTLNIFNNRKISNFKWEHFPKTDMIILSEKFSPDPALVRKYLSPSVIIENRTSAKEIDENNSTQITLNDSKILNTNQGGSVQITFRSADEGEKSILNCKYFNR
jgi:competence protein ComEC